MNKRFDVVALCELLIDFTANGTSEQGNPLFEANPGGAPCNVLAMLRKLDKKCAFIGKVGDDMFGRQLKAVAEAAGIDMSGLRMDQSVHTTLAFVQTDAYGDRDFSFYRNPGADMMLTEEELPLDMLRDAKIFHFGTLSMTHEAVRQATKAAVLAAKEAGAIISFDPNLRPPLWDSLNEARAQMLWGLSQADVVKIADYASYQDRKVFVPSFLLGGTIETTGAGDTFCASVLNFVLDHGLNGLSKDDLRAMLRFANAAAYLVTTRKGAIRSMPERAQVEAILREH